MSTATTEVSFNAFRTTMGSDCRLPKGTYWVGDPCYVFGHDPHSIWSDICDAFFPKDNSGDKDVVIMDYHGKRVFMFGTAHGDGQYPVKRYGETLGHAGVDSGTLSFIPLSLIDEQLTHLKELEAQYGKKDKYCPDSWPYSHILELGVIVDLKCGQVPSYDAGDATVGSFSVLTSEQRDDEDDED